MKKPFLGLSLILLGLSLGAVAASVRLIWVSIDNAEAKPVAQLKSVDDLCPNEVFGNGVYYFHCTGRRFATALSEFRDIHPEREAPAETVISFSEVDRGHGTIVITQLKAASSK